MDAHPGGCPLLVVIVNHKTAALTVACLESARPEIEAIPGARVVVVENDSGDADALREAIAARGWEDWVTLEVADRNGGFAAGNNLAIRPALSSDDPPAFVMLLNADTEVRPGAFAALLGFLGERPDVGIAGSTFENLDGSTWPFAFRFMTPFSELEEGLRLSVVTRLLRRRLVAREMEQDRPQPVDWVAGACMVIRREVFDAVGLMDEGYFLYYEEVDFCLRARRAGWPCWYVPAGRVMHIAGQSSKLTVRDRRPPRTPPYWFASRRRYYLKNHGLAAAIAADLAFGLGYAAYRLRRAIRRTADLDPPDHLADFWRNSVVLPKNRAIGLPGPAPAPRETAGAGRVGSGRS
jgi:N-acetylglucosaminyl-diphospho-decaprenol L-rhamnosyltransferase